MTNNEILEKAIQKAIAGGWTVNDWTDADDFEWRVQIDEYDQLEMWYCGLGEDWYLSVRNIIFNHDFAKALWSEETPSPNYGDLEMLSEPDFAWEHHLQQMVIADDPIKYLGDNL